MYIYIYIDKLKFLHSNSNFLKFRVCKLYIFMFSAQQGYIYLIKIVKTVI